MPNFPVHNFGMDKMLEGVQSGLGSYMKGRLMSFEQKQEQEKLIQERQLAKEKQTADQEFNVAMKVFDTANKRETPFLVKQQGYQMVQSVLGKRGISINFDPYLTAAENQEVLKTQYLNNMAQQMETFENATDAQSRRKAGIELQKLVTDYTNLMGEEPVGYNYAVRKIRETMIEEIRDKDKAGRQLTPQEIANLKIKRDINLSPEQRAFQSLTPEEQQRKARGLTPQQEAFQSLSPEEQKETVMRSEQKETGVLTEGSVKKSIDELAMYDMKKSSSLYKNYLKYRNEYTKTGMNISAAREQALSKIQMEAALPKPDKPGKKITVEQAKAYIDAYGDDAEKMAQKAGWSF